MPSCYRRETGPQYADFGHLYSGMLLETLKDEPGEAARRATGRDQQRMQVIHRRLVTLTLATFAAMLAGLPASPIDDKPRANPAPTRAVQRVKWSVPGVRDEPAMVVVGTALIGLAAAVRRAG